MALETRILVKAPWTLADRCGGLESGLGASPPVRICELRHRTACAVPLLREALAERTTVFGADQSARVRKDRTTKRVRPEGFEPSTLGSEDRCAIQLRHGRITKLSLTDAVKILKGGNRQLEKPWEGCF